jgi:hypothetical protein
MNHQIDRSSQSKESSFALNLIAPYSTFEGGEPKRIPYVIDGLLPEGGFSILAGKPKHGKSSLSRYEAVCVSKGRPFLGRTVMRGEVILVSIEDPVNHVDNCLQSLGYDPANDAPIHLVTKLAPEGINASIEAIEKELERMPNVRLVIVDTLAKLLRVSDVNDYSKVLPQVEKIHDLARKFPHLHIQGLAHCKKVKTDDPFDSLLGSTALRGEPDTTIALYDDAKQRVIASETRIGRNIPPTILHAELVESAGADVVKAFSLDKPLAEFQAVRMEKAERKQRMTHESRIIAFLQTCDGHSATQETTLREVEGRRTTNSEAIGKLSTAGVLTISGTKQSPVDPLTLHLNADALSTYSFTEKFGGMVD